MSNDGLHRDFGPTASWKNLRLRATLLRRIRDFFDDEGFLEVETPLLSADTVVDRHLDPFPVEFGLQSGGPSRTYWLQTSPEFGMKRLLAAKTPDAPKAIYQVTKAFRQEEVGPLHNPEFTMVEWYQVIDEDEGRMQAGMALTSRLCDALLQRGPAENVRYGEAFERHVGIAPHTAETADLIEAAKRQGVVAPESLSPEDRDSWLDLLLVESVQPHLGTDRPVLLYDYPASQAALARIRSEPPSLENPPVAERFELYVDGLELANGYHELLDPAELMRRSNAINDQRRGDGKPILPTESRLTMAMESGLPPSVGVALGFDRVVMLAAGAKNIEEVMAFPFGQA